MSIESRPMSPSMPAVGDQVVDVVAVDERGHGVDVVAPGEPGAAQEATCASPPSIDSPRQLSWTSRKRVFDSL